MDVLLVAVALQVLHVYLVYIPLVIVLALAWMSLRTWWAAS